MNKTTAAVQSANVAGGNENLLNFGLDTEIANVHVIMLCHR